MIARHGTPHVIILVGNNPLPICQVLTTLKPEKVTLLYGKAVDPSRPSLSAEVVKRVERFWNVYWASELGKTSNPVISAKPVHPFDPSVAREDVEALLKEDPDLMDGTLVYGPGTSAMNVVVHKMWAAKNPDSADCWYPGLDGYLRRDLDSHFTMLCSTGGSLAALALMHERKGEQFTTGVRPNIAVKDLQLVGECIKSILYDGVTPSDASSEAMERSRLPWSGKGAKKGSPDLGTCLESAVAAFLLARYGQPSGSQPSGSSKGNFEVMMNAMFVNSGTKKIEVDVLARRNDRVVVVSCASTTQNEIPVVKNGKVVPPKSGHRAHLRKKSFEVKAHKERFGGSETRALTAALLIFKRQINGQSQTVYDIASSAKTNKEVRGDLFRSATEPESAETFVDISELLGDDPAKTLTNGGEGDGQAKWLLEWLDWNLRDTSQAPSVI